MNNVTVPTPEQIKQDFQAITKSGTHPRIMLKSYDFDKIRNFSKTDAYMMRTYETVYKTAEALLAKPLCEYTLAHKDQLLETSREVKSRMETLCMVYQISGEERFAERAFEEMQNAACFSTWNPNHFLDVAEMTYAFAVGYDWLYHWLTQEQRRFLVDAITQKGINEALPYIMSGEGWWVESVSNWTTICNGGITTAVLALFEENPDLYAQMIVKSIGYVKNAMAEVAPNGSYPEGPGYWHYGTSYTVFMLSSLYSVLGNMYGLDKIQGMKETGGFPLYISANDGGMFNFSDCAYVSVNAPQTFWFAKQYHMPVYGWQQKQLFPQGSALDMVWYDPNFVCEPEEVDLPLDMKYDGAESLVTFRSSFQDKNGLFIALKAGDNQSLHGDLDIGTFVFDVGGTRFAHDLGSEDYCTPGYWELDEHAGRWNCYGKRAEGHNTLVINPDGEADQNVYAVDRFVNYQTSSDSAFAVLDMSNAYQKQAKTVRRGLQLFDNRTKFAVQDDIVCKGLSDVYWFMHTDGAIEIIDDGKTAILTKEDKQVKAVLSSPLSGRFEVMEALPLPQSPKSATNLNWDRFKKLFIHLKSVEETTIYVTFIPNI